MNLGKSSIDMERCEFVASVTGGGACGPGELAIYDNGRWRPLEICEDNRSLTGKSRSVRYDISQPGLYRYVGVAIGNRRVASGYFERTPAGEYIALNSDQHMLIRQRELYPEIAHLRELEHRQQVAWAIEHEQRQLDAQHEVTARKGQAERERVKAIGQLARLSTNDIISKSTFVRRAVQVNGRGSFDYSMLPERMLFDDLITIICPKHRPFKIVASDHLSGAGCPICDGTLGLT